MPDAGTVEKPMQHMDFWSQIDNLVTLTTTSTDVALPDIVVSDIPTGVTVSHVTPMLKIRELEDTSTANNAINGSPVVKVQADAAGWGAAAVTAIDVADNSLFTAASSTSPGDIIVGDNDVSSKVTGNGTYNARFDGSVVVDGNSLRMYDVQMGLRMYFR